MSLNYEIYLHILELILHNRNYLNKLKKSADSHSSNEGKDERNGSN